MQQIFSRIRLIGLFLLLVSPLFAQNTASWRQALGGAIISRPIAQVESVVLITDAGNLRSYSSRGNLLWDYYSRTRLSPFLSRSREGTSYIARSNGVLIAINRSGRELWQINLGSPLVSPVIIGWDGRLFVFTRGRITCMTASGYTLWSRPLEGETVLAPFLDHSGGIILVMNDGGVRKLDPFGNLISYVYIDDEDNITRNNGIPVAAASLETPERGPAILLLYENRQLELIYTLPGTTSSGAIEEAGFGISLRGVLELPSAPLLAAGFRDRVAVLLRDGRVGIISMGGMREILWTRASHASAGELAANPDIHLLLDERGLYLITRNGASGFGPAGESLWSIRLSNTAALPSFSDEGILYSGGEDWILYAFNMEDRVRPRQRLLYGVAPPGTYNRGAPSSFADFDPYDERIIEGRFSEINRAINNGTVGGMELDYSAWLMEIAGVVIPNPDAARSSPVRVQHRTEAARLLGFIGSSETIAFLTTLFTRDPSSNVKAAAARAIGRIGVDPEGLAIRAFTYALLPPSPITEENVLLAIAEATGALCRFSGPPLSEAGIRILGMLSVPERPQIIRNQALREIDSF